MEPGRDRSGKERSRFFPFCQSPPFFCQVGTEEGRHHRWRMQTEMHEVSIRGPFGVNMAVGKVFGQSDFGNFGTLH